uniref:Uncharacterized protein n=1 Tax=Oryza meridionalis TaxID=40149 RepID=A0A0E0E1W3_9ORYZ
MAWSAQREFKYSSPTLLCPMPEARSVSTIHCRVVAQLSALPPMSLGPAHPRSHPVVPRSTTATQIPEASKTSGNGKDVLVTSDPSSRKNLTGLGGSPRTPQATTRTATAASRAAKAEDVTAKVASLGPTRTPKIVVRKTRRSTRVSTQDNPGDAETTAGNSGWPSGGASTDAAADSARPSGGDAAGAEVGGGNESTGAAANSVWPSKGDVAGAEVGAGDGSKSAAANSAQPSGGNAAGAEAGAGDGTFWFQGGREKEALKEGFDDAADKAYATVDVKTRRPGRSA